MILLAFAVGLGESGILDAAEGLSRGWRVGFCSGVFVCSERPFLRAERSHVSARRSGSLAQYPRPAGTRASGGGARREARRPSAPLRGAVQAREDRINELVEERGMPHMPTMRAWLADLKMAKDRLHVLREAQQAHRTVIAELHVRIAALERSSQFARLFDPRWKHQPDLEKDKGI